jgi:hypothetical protein
LYTPPSYEVKRLTGNRLYVDDRKTVEIYNQVFCLETFVEDAEKVSEVSAFLCLPSTPDQQFPSPNKPKEPLSCSTHFRQMVKNNSILNTLVQWKPLDVITLGQRESDNINRPITLTEQAFRLVYGKNAKWALDIFNLQ